MNKTFVIVIISIIFLFIAMILLRDNGTTAPNQAACTAEAMQCPDGSYVGRSGPNCEFTACPVVLVPAGWVTGSNDVLRATYQYPEQLSATYMHVTDWPPQITVSSDPYTCAQTGTDISVGGQIHEQTINGRSYCITQINEGAAGSIYTKYSYATELNSRYIILTFTMRAVQCGNYNDPEKTACEAERQTFQIDPIVDQIVHTIKFQ